MSTFGGFGQGATAKPEYKLDKWLSEAWNLFKARAVELTALTLAAIVPVMIIMAGIIPMQIILLEREGNRGFALYPSGLEILTSILAVVLSAAVVTPFSVGIAAVVLNYVRTGTVDWSRIWTGYKKWTDCFIIGIVPGGIFNFFTMFPLLLIAIPIWIAVLLWAAFTVYALSEPGARFGDAIKKGLDLIEGNFWQAVLFYLVAGLIGISGVIACCIGAVVTSAYMNVLVATAYNSLTSKPADAS